MSDKVSGGCHCGHTRYAFSGKPGFRVQCFCRDCQYFAGGGPQTTVFVPREGFEITQGDTHSYHLTADSGSAVTRQFCSQCFTQLFVETESRPDSIALTAGTLDDPDQFPPRASIWVDSATHWANINPELPQYH